MVSTKPTIIELDMGKLEDALRRAEGKLDEQDYAMLKALADSYAYTGAEKIEIRHPSLQPGDPCPRCEAGTVYETGRYAGAADKRTDGKAAGY